jgi:hypothetical protein
MLVLPTTDQEGFLMSFRTQVLTYCKKHDIKVYDDSVPGFRASVTLWTPKGKVFSATGTHNVVSTFLIEPQVHVKNDAWVELAGDIHYGLEDCTNRTCETCHEDEIDITEGKG